MTTPSAGRPPAPASAQAATSSEAFAPYAGLGASTDDGLAPEETYSALHTACMNDAGYSQYADDTPFFARTNRGLAFAQPDGPWGYLGTALAAQYGFIAPAARNDSSSGPPATPGASLPAGPAGRRGQVPQHHRDIQQRPAVQTSYEQQFVNANQQALAAAVREYKAAYAKELGQLPGLLTTAPTTPAGGRAVRPSMS